jgi:DNA polymerase-3 subunit gamma/tau
VATVAQPVVVAEAATDSNALRQLWPEVMAALRDRSKVKWAMMNEVVIASVEGEVVNLLAPAGLARRIAEESNLSVLREVLQSVVFGHWQLTISAAASANGAAGPDEPMTEPDPAPDPAPRAARPEPSGRPERSAPSERSGRAESPTRAARPEPADQPPAPVADDDGVDEESDEVHGSPRAGGDAEAAAIELLQTSLGARPIDAS